MARSSVDGDGRPHAHPALSHRRHRSLASAWVGRAALGAVVAAVILCVSLTINEVQVLTAIPIDQWRAILRRCRTVAPGMCPSCGTPILGSVLQVSGRLVVCPACPEDVSGHDEVAVDSVVADGSREIGMRCSCGAYSTIEIGGPALESDVRERARRGFVIHRQLAGLLCRMSAETATAA